MQICREFDLLTTGAGILRHAAGYFVADDVIRTDGIRLIDEEIEVTDTEDAPATWARRWTQLPCRRFPHEATAAIPWACMVPVRLGCWPAK